MAKLVLGDITNITGNESSATATLNANNQATEDALENTLSRDGTSPNEMNADFDMNGYDILNAGNIDTTTLFVGGVDVHNIVGTQGEQGPIGPSGNDGLVQSIVAGTGISVDSTDPANPIVTNTGAVSDGDKGDIFVSGSGTVWTIDKTLREVLTANRTYYVRTDGSDSNTGLVNNSGGAFLTIAKGLTTAAGLDGSTYNVVVQVGAGTWTVPVVLPQFIGSGAWYLRGDTTTPANVLISVTSANAVSADSINSVWRIEGFKLQTTTAGSGFSVANSSVIQYSAINFGACALSHVRAANKGMAVAYGNTSITANSLIHWYLDAGGTIFDAGFTITITGTPAFANSFVQAQGASLAKVNNNTFSGSATGKRYYADTNSVVGVNGGGATYLPGDVSGTTSTGGQYN